MPTTYTLMTWNLLHGGGPKRIPEITLTLLDLAPDLLLLTEFRPARGGQLAGVLADHGWNYQRQATQSPTTNGLLLASRFPLTDAPSNPPPPKGLESRWIECSFPTLGLGLAGLHIPHKGSGTRRTALWKHAVDRARTHRDSDFMLLGDFNTGRNHLDGPANAFDCTQRLGELAALRYTDAWRADHPDSAEGTWSSPDHNDHRIDHAHVSESLQPRVQTVWHDHSVTALGLSDHAALMVTITGSPASTRPKNA